MARSTLVRTIVQEVAEVLYAGRPYGPVAVTPTGGSTTTIVDSSWLGAGPNDANAYDRWAVWPIECDAAAPEGEVRFVSDGGWAAASGTWTVGQAFSSSVQSGDTVLLMPWSHPDELMAAVNRVLSGKYWPRYTILTLVPDGDMEATGTGSWTALGGGSVSKTTTAASVMSGRQALTVSGSATDDGVRSESVLVHDPETLQLSVFMRVTAGSQVQVQLYNVTGSSVIDFETVYGPTTGWVEVRFQGTVPEDCTQVQVRVVSGTGSFTAQVDCIGLLSTARVLVPLTTGAGQQIDARHVEALFAPRSVFSSGDSNRTYIAMSQPADEWPRYGELQDYRGVGSDVVDVGHVTDTSVWVKWLEEGTGVAQGADTWSALETAVYAPPEVIVSGTVAEMFERQAAHLTGAYRNQRLQESMEWKQRHRRLLEKLGRGRPRVRSVAKRRTQIPSAF